MDRTVNSVDISPHNQLSKPCFRQAIVKHAKQKGVKTTPNLNLYARYIIYN